MLDILKDVKHLPLILICFGASSTEETVHIRTEVWRSSAHGPVQEFHLCWIWA